MKKIVVIGSINMDLVTICKRVPKEGETLIGGEFAQFPGGKGANQAVAIGKMGAPVTFLGKVGKDSLGEELLKSMAQAGVDISHIEKEEGSTGIATILLEESAHNRIIVVPGANFLVDKEYVDRHLEAIEEADILVAQLEIPLETVKYALRKAKELGKMTILNPAPAVELEDSIIENADYIIPNETELELISKVKVTDTPSVLAGSRKLLDKGVKNLLVTLGSEGVMHIDREEYKKYPAFKVEAVDTTAAGDSFIGGFVKGLSQGDSTDEAVRLGTAVAALAVTKMGAQSSIPTEEEVKEFLKSR